MFYPLLKLGYTQIILPNFAIQTSSSRKRLLSTWKSVQEQTQNLMCWNLSVLTVSKPLIYMTTLRITLEYKSWHTLESCQICLNNFNNQEEVIGHMNISPWTDLKLPTHRPVCPYCQQTLGKKWQNWGPHLYSLVMEINYMKYVINYFIITLLLQQVGNILLELKHVLGSFVTIMNICKWMLSVES